MLRVDPGPTARSMVAVQVDQNVSIGLRLSITARAGIWHSQMFSRFVFLPRSVARGCSKMLLAKAVLALASFPGLGQEVLASSQHAIVNTTEANPTEE